MVFAATTSGTYVLLIGSRSGGWSDNNGPFHFVVTVPALLYAAKQISTSTRGTLTVYVRNADGGTITSAALDVDLYGRWRDAPVVPPSNHLLASGHPARGIVKLEFIVPSSLAGKTVLLVVAANGPTFLASQDLLVSDHVGPSRSSGAGPKAYVANGTGGVPGTVTPVDLASRRAGEPIVVPDGASGVAIMPNGSTLYVADGVAPNGAITPVDLRTGRAGRPIAIPEGADGPAIAPGGKIAYVADGVAPGGAITPVDLSTRTVGAPIAIPDGADQVEISPNGRTAYVGNGRGSVTPVDLESGALEATIQTPYDGPGTISGLGLSPSGATLYVTTPEGITPINVATGLEGTLVPVAVSSLGPPGTGSIAVSANGKTAYVTSDDEILGVNLATGALAKPITLAGGAARIAIG
jgi:hypothetical protein